MPTPAPLNARISTGLDGYYAPAEGGGGKKPGVIVLMEAFGLTPHVRGLCDRFAAAGYAALAPDLYQGRQFGYAQLDEALGVLGSLDWLGRQDGVDGARLAVSGFCMGGRLAFLSACRHGARLRAAVSFYGGSIAPGTETDKMGRKPPIGEAPQLAVPALLVYGARDKAIPGEEHGRIAQALTGLNKRYAVSVYPDAGHGFCCEDRDAYAPKAAEAAFAETFDFLRRCMAD